MNVLCETYLTFKDSIKAGPFLFVLSWLLASCAVTTQEMAAQDPSKVTVCKEPRSQVCTMDYSPVCADVDDGNNKTYSNGCNACSDAKVIRYREGVCEK